MKMLRELKNGGGAPPLTSSSKGFRDYGTPLPQGRGTVSKKQAAFTLAEVLITLGIIGIVAAITIPTLVQKYQERAWNTAANVFQRKLETALGVMNSQNTLAGHASTFSFVNELSKHLKITKICSNDDLINCFEDKVYWNIIDVVTGTSTEEISIADIHTASDLGQDDWDSEVIGFQLANGSVGLIAYNPECKADQYNNQFTGTSCISMIYDTSGLKKPNTYTKDLRGVNSKLTNCAFKIGGTCFSQPFKAESYLTFDECQALKSTLGIEYCYANNAPHNRDTNYYAAAAKICGGADNFPTHSELCSVAEYLYNVDSCEEVSSISSIDGIHLDKDKLDALGIPLNTSIFTSENGYTGTGAFTFYQKNIFSAGSVNGAFYPHNYAICRL